LAGSAARIERCEAASQVAAGRRPLRQQQAARAERSCCSACTFSRSTSAPVLTAPKHQVVAAAVVTAISPGLQLSVCLLPTADRQNRTSDRQERPALNHVVAKSTHARREPDDGD
jgi:hypothetical protein